MKPDPAAEALRWMDQAERDLDDARLLAQEDRWNLACFVAQQAAEKAVKAFLYSIGRQIVYGHSVDVLLKEATAKEPSFEALRADGAKLDRLYIPTRYPNGLPGGVPYEAFDAGDAEDALRRAERILAAVRKHVA